MVVQKGFTIAELLVVMVMLSFIIGTGIAIARTTASGLFTGQVETTNRSKLEDNILILAREIESAEKIYLSDDGRTLKISQDSSDSEDECPSTYSIEDNQFKYNEQKMFDLNTDVDESGNDLSYFAYTIENNAPVIIIHMQLRGDNINTIQAESDIEYKFVSRNNTVIFNNVEYVKNNP